MIPTKGVTKMEEENMKDRDIAGLAVFQDPYGYIARKQDKGSKQVIMVNNGETVTSVPMKGETIYLRTSASNSTSIVTFEYSYDNQKFIAPGNELTMSFSLKIFTGNKFCLFNSATQKTGGYVDFDWFRVNQKCEE